MTTLEHVERLNAALLELDELIVLLSTADDLIERELWLARAGNVRRHISTLIREEMSTPTDDTTDDLKGYDC